MIQRCGYYAHGIVKPCGVPWKEGGTGLRRHTATGGVGAGVKKMTS